MNGMMIHPKVDNPDPNAVAKAHDEGCRGWSGFAVQQQPVELHVHCVRHGVVRKYGILLKKNDKILVNPGGVGDLGVHDKGPKHADHLLHGHMRVVEEGSRLVKSKFVHETAAGRNRILTDAGSAIHTERNLETVPMHGCRLRQMVIDNHANSIALGDLNRGSRSTAVETPEIESFAG